MVGLTCMGHGACVTYFSFHYLPIFPYSLKSIPLPARGSSDLIYLFSYSRAEDDGEATP